MCNPLHNPKTFWAYIFLNYLLEWSQNFRNVFRNHDFPICHVLWNQWWGLYFQNLLVDLSDTAPCISYQTSYYQTNTRNICIAQTEQYFSYLLQLCRSEVLPLLDHTRLRSNIWVKIFVRMPLLSPLNWMMPTADNSLFPKC